LGWLGSSLSNADPRTIAGTGSAREGVGRGEEGETTRGPNGEMTGRSDMLDGTGSGLFRRDRGGKGKGKRREWQGDRDRDRDREIQGRETAMVAVGGLKGLFYLESWGWKRWSTKRWIWAIVFVMVSRIFSMPKGHELEPR
jgi:hypothetical protein